jgi:hypothetical protein
MRALSVLPAGVPLPAAWKGCDPRPQAGPARTAATAAAPTATATPTPTAGAVGCQTRLKDGWFWMRCEGKVAFSAVGVERGKRPTQTKAAVEGGAARPYVEETDLRARLAYEGGETR